MASLSARELDETSPIPTLQLSTTSQPTAKSVKMGRVRTKTVKKSAKVIIERYYPKLTLDFETNKRVCDEIAIIASKRLRNKVSLLSMLLGGVLAPGGLWNGN